MNRLCEQASGLFIYARTATGFIRDELHDRGTQSIGSIFQLLNSEPLPTIDKLYLTILGQAYDPSRTETMDYEVFRRVVGAIIVLRAPLNRKHLKELLDIRVQRKGVEEVPDFASLFGRLRSILIPGASANNNDTIPRIHKSFIDFITSKTRCVGPWHVDTSVIHRYVAVACLRFMKGGLRFNICGLESSYLRNADIQDLALRIETAIPAPLSYACRFWVDHLQAASFDIEILDDVRGFLHDRFLYWLEVLSLINETSYASSALLSVARWIGVSF